MCLKICNNLVKKKKSGKNVCIKGTYPAVLIHGVSKLKEPWVFMVICGPDMQAADHSFPARN